MSIATVADVRKVLDLEILKACLYQEANPTANEAQVETKVQEVLDVVDGLVKGHLRGRYTLPMDPWPDPLPYAATQLAVYDILNRRGLSEKDPADQSAIRGRKEALATLKAIAAGSIVLEDTQTAPEQNLSVDIEGPDRVFSRDNMKGW